nr:hypothetical protein [Tanacetum cinerariifolium]
MFDIDYLTDSLNYSRVSSTNLTTDNLDELAELQALQRKEQAGKKEADRLRLAFPSLNLILGVGTASIGSSISAGSTPPISAGSTPQIPVSAGRPTGSAGRLVSTSNPTGSAGRPVSVGRPSGSAARTPIPADIHDGLKIFDCLKSGIFTSSFHDEEFSGPDANSLASSVDVSSTITKRIHNIHPTSQILGFMVYQMNVKSAFLYGKITKEVYVTQPRGFEDPDYLKKVYKVVKALYGLHQAPEAWYKRLSTFLLKHGYRRGTIDKTLFIKKDSKDIMLVQVYITPSLPPFELQKIREKNVPDESISVHLYRSMIGCLMYLTATRPDIMFAVCAAARHQVTPKTSNLVSVKRIFKYLTAYPKLDLWYPRDSPFDLEAFTNSDYAGTHRDRKSPTSGCQFLGRRLISWQ